MTALESALKVILREAVRDVLRDELRGGGDGPEYLTAKEAAKVVSVSPATIREWVRQGLKAYGPGHVRRVKLTELREFIERQASRVADDNPKARAAAVLASISTLKRAR